MACPPLILRPSLPTIPPVSPRARPRSPGALCQHCHLHPPILWQCWTPSAFTPLRPVFISQGWQPSTLLATLFRVRLSGPCRQSGSSVPCRAQKKHASRGNRSSGPRAASKFFSRRRSRRQSPRMRDGRRPVAREAGASGYRQSPRPSQAEIAGANFTMRPANTTLTMLMSLMRMFRLGPEVSLNGSPTVSPTTPALWSSEPLP